ncbi:adenosylmethionine--8-amino-7-oxononanoate transaminase [Acidithiobacillus montserratensis]|uniref:Adenosylmethionine--8-amino-7-oxononanoate transaminase n=1 Tax=Acidithiobacillus montserratensis TaxID=2729135 RepID=A0ACD5HB52_9PROT|nr:adenosylmethionine--8-amino-7-oxononanoate transaminase [Acidithiobacillus montserratensis]
MTSETEMLKAWDRRYFWHPFTQMQCYGDDDPWIIDRAEGHYLYNMDGERCLDAVASLWCNVHGHRHPRLDHALLEQLGKVAHSTSLGASNPPAIRLAKKLVDCTPGSLQHCFFTEDGSEAVEVAIKMAAQYWVNVGRPQKRLFLTLDNAYHGDTVGAVSVGGFPLFHEVYGNLLFPTRRLSSPYVLQWEQCQGDGQAAARLWLQALEALLRAEKDDTAALILEGGVQGAAGILPFPAGILQGAQQLCNAHDVLLIVDEVATGFGRSGKLFSCEREGVEPDLLALGKGLSGGYLPIAATLASEKIYQAFLAPFGEARQFYYGHTFTANPLACAVALENLDIFAENSLLSELPEKIARLQKGLERFRGQAWAGDPRQFGLMAGIPLRNPVTGVAYPYGERVEYMVCKRAREMGVYSRPLGDLLTIVPPLSVTAAEIDTILQTLFDAMAEGNKQ